MAAIFDMSVRQVLHTEPDISLASSMPDVLCNPLIYLRSMQVCSTVQSVLTTKRHPRCPQT